MIGVSAFRQVGCHVRASPTSMPHPGLGQHPFLSWVALAGIRQLGPAWEVNEVTRIGAGSAPLASEGRDKVLGTVAGTDGSDTGQHFDALATLANS